MRKWLIRVLARFFGITEEEFIKRLPREPDFWGGGS